MSNNNELEIDDSPLAVKFLKVLPKITWFIEKYFGNDHIKYLVELANANKNEVLYTELNNIWFILPDAKFNIVVMPPGWKELLSLIEE